MTAKQSYNNQSACLMGEKLRMAFWPPTKDGDIGCYTNFIYSSSVYDIEQDEDTHWAKLLVDGIVIDLAWCWDGDGYITFTYTDPKSNHHVVLVNDDCKKNHTWEYV